MVFGEAPEWIELDDIGLVSLDDQRRVGAFLSGLGSSANVWGNLEQARVSAKGLYRLGDETMRHLNTGGQLATKDGANLAAVFKKGKIVHQARLVPYKMSAATIATSLGPTVTMVAMQMQLNEISRLVSTNIALTSQTLKAIRNEQWAELEGLAKSIERAKRQAIEIGAVTKSLWENVAGHEAVLEKQLALYRNNVRDHVKELAELEGAKRRQFLEMNAEALLFDTHALLHALRAQTTYQTIRAARAREASAHDEDEAALLEVILRDAQLEFLQMKEKASRLIDELVRELRIIAQLPGRATLPLTKSRRGSNADRLTCQQLLDAVEPLARTLAPEVPELMAPELLCAPDALELEPYLGVLRWHLLRGEEVLAMAFAYQAGGNVLADVLPGVLAARADAAWSALTPSRWSGLTDRLARATLVVVTNQRVVTADSRQLLNLGEIEMSIPLRDIEFVRLPSQQKDQERPAVNLVTKGEDLVLLFAAETDVSTVESFAQLIETLAADAELRSLETGGRTDGVLES